MGAGLGPRGAGEEGQAAHPSASRWGPEDGHVGPSSLAQKIMFQFSK